MKQHIFEFQGAYTHFEKKSTNDDEIRELMSIAQILDNHGPEVHEFKTCTLVTIKMPANWKLENDGL